MSIENEIAGLTQSTTDLLEAVNTKKATLDTAVSNAQTAVTDATSQVSLAAAEKVGAQTARDTAESFKDQAYTYSQSAASAVAYQDLTAIAQTKAETAVDVFVYDTTKDSDGGAWRKRTQHTSWYNETLNTATRGSRKEFPAVAVIVAEATQITIYDGDDPSMPMWMVFDASKLTWADPASAVTSGSMVNGVLVVGSSKSGTHFSFIRDYSKTLYTGNFIFGSPRIIDRNVSGFSGSSSEGFVIVNRAVNDIAMTVLPDAPIDPATGLPIPTIAVATDGGVSVIKDDGTVVDITGFVEKPSDVNFKENGELISTGEFDQMLKVFDIPTSDTTVSSYKRRYSYHQAPKIDPPADGVYATYDIQSNKDTLYRASSKALVTISENVASKTTGMVSFTASDYNTGWMNGDIKLATLSDTDDTDLVGTELVTNGTFDSDVSGWTVNPEGEISVDNGKLKILNVSGRARAYLNGITVTPGKHYVLTFDAIEGNTTGFTHVTGDTVDTTNIPQDRPFYFYATGTTINLQFGVGTAIAGYYAYYDNVSIIEAEPDRSVNNNGLQVFGTVTREPVATGADLVAYSGFSSSNYLVQPYNPDLDFGTGDFCMMGWVNVNPSFSATDYIFSRGTHLGYSLNANGSIYSFHADGISVSVSGLQTGAWQFVCCGVRDGKRFISLNSGEEQQSAISTSVDESNAPLIIGTYAVGSSASFYGSLALLRISGTAPTPEQIEKIYNDEKVLFQEGAQATLYGTSDAVTALAYDDTTELLHVGTSSGRSVFQGLKRVDNTTDAVGTAISASNNLIVEE